jgi:hypothetical protein
MSNQHYLSHRDIKRKLQLVVQDATARLTFHGGINSCGSKGRQSELRHDAQQTTGTIQKVKDTDDENWK